MALYQRHFSADAGVLNDPYLGVVCGIESDSPRSARKAGTIRSQRIYFLRLGRDLKWYQTDKHGKSDIMLTAFDQSDKKEAELQKEKGQLWLAILAVHLANGNSLQCRQVWCDTIKEYVRLAALLLKLFTDRDFRFDNPGDNRFCPRLANVYKEVQRYEDLPKRRNPYFPAMHLRLRRWRK